MKISRGVRNGYALALACMLALPCLLKIQTSAAMAIDVDKNDCSLTVSVEASVGDDQDKAFKEDLNEMKIPVSLYRVADVDVSGRYTGVGYWESMKFDTVSSTTTAQDWSELAAQAYELSGGAQPDVAGDVEKKEQEDTASVSFTGLRTGMYLVAPEAAFNADYSYKYTFTPYLTALPGNAYAQTGAENDTWEYDPVIGLKAERERQTGALKISKTLDTYNETLGATTCVFQVEGRDGAGDVVYSNVISATLNGADDAETVRLTGIPAGLKVTVKEVYAGANYQVVGSDTRENVTIVSDAHPENVNGNRDAAVSFNNRYNGGNRGGYGVTNHFEADGKNGWKWTTDVQQD